MPVELPVEQEEKILKKFLLVLWLWFLFGLSLGPGFLLGALEPLVGWIRETDPDWIGEDYLLKAMVIGFVGSMGWLASFSANKILSRYTVEGAFSNHGLDNLTIQIASSAIAFFLLA